MRPTRVTSHRSVLAATAAGCVVALAVAANAGATGPGGIVPSKTTPPPAPVPTTPQSAGTTVAAVTTAPAVPVTTVAGSPTLPPLPATTVPGPTVAAGMVQLADTTGRITMSVPGAWSDTDVRPFVRDDGGHRPSIEASPDLSTYLQGWTTPGAFLVALPPQDPAALIEAWSWNSSCREGDPQPFTNAGYSGLTQTWTACGGGTAEIVELAVTSADGTYSVYVNVRSPVADPATNAQIFDSIAAVPGANPGELSAPVAPPTALMPTDPALAAPVVPPGSGTVTDDTGRLSFAVDPTWLDVNGIPRDNDDLSARPTVRVAPSLDSYLRDWAAPGLSVSAMPPRTDPYTILANTAPTASCTDGGVQALALPTGTGFLHTWTNCGDTTTRIVQFVVTPSDQSAVVWGEAQLPTADDTPVAAVLASLALTA